LTASPPNRRIAVTVLSHWRLTLTYAGRYQQDLFRKGTNDGIRTSSAAGLQLVHSLGQQRLGRPSKRTIANPASQPAVIPQVKLEVLAAVGRRFRAGRADETFCGVGRLDRRRPQRGLRPTLSTRPAPSRLWPLQSAHRVDGPAPVVRPAGGIRKIGGGDDSTY